MYCNKESWLTMVCRRLRNEKGRLRVIARDSGVPYSTLTKIVSGVVSDPRVSTVQTLFDYFADRSEAHTPPEFAAVPR